MEKAVKRKLRRISGSSQAPSQTEASEVSEFDANSVELGEIKSHKDFEESSRIYFHEDLIKDDFLILFEAHKISGNPKLPPQQLPFDKLVEGLNSNTTLLDLYGNKDHKQAMSSKGSRLAKEDLTHSYNQVFRKHHLINDRTIEISKDVQKLEQHQMEEKDKKFKESLLSAKCLKAKSRVERDWKIIEQVIFKGATLHEASRLAKTSTFTTSRVCKFFRDNGTIADLCRIDEHSELPSLSLVEEFLDGVYKERGFLARSFKELKTVIIQRFPALAEVSERRLTNSLKQHIKLKRTKYVTRPAKLKDLQYDNLVKAVSMLFLDLIQRDTLLLFLDESAFFEANFMDSAIGNEIWCPTKKKKGEVKGLSIIAALSQHRVEAVQAFRKAPNAKSFEEFIRGLLVKLKAEYRGKLTSVVLFIDNSPIHRTQVVRRFFNELNLNVIYGIPSTPAQNPVEKLFMVVKAPLRQTLSPSPSDLLPLVSSCLSKASKVPGLSYIKLALKEFANF